MSIIESEVLIVGAGVFGVSTAYYLAKQSSNPSSITILDRDRPPSTPAASTDYNKIIRADYSDPLYMDLAFEAIDAWKKNSLFTTAGVYHETGWISMGERDSDLTSQIRDNFQMSGRPDPTKDMTENEVRSSWGGILKDADLRPFDSYYYNPSAGWAEAGAALKIMADEAIRMGVQYKIDEANRLMLDQHGVRGVQTNNGKIYTAKKIILATGAWTSEMMTLTEDQLRMPMESRIESQLTAAGVCVVHYKLTDAERGSYDQLPVCVYGEQGETLPPTASGLIKFTNTASFKNTVHTDNGQNISIPPIHQRAIPYGLRRQTVDSIKDRLPTLFSKHREVDHFRLCWDAITPSQNPLITRHPHPHLSNLYLATGGSFHCWKFLPIIGRYVTNVIYGISNGADRDKAWGWKDEQPGQGVRGVHGSLMPWKELRDFQI
ncbi:FAD dependent oxidoreductase [Penicillium longicatenatum]|uniref:FAD dependent oxidoreductase n=1 Tax=Penicillium longicatenatum TaxID=1561947 RepID=UPI002547E4D9|nr:FAD dependent oxidoreductase [Penicillium longicatenatum]KAJ5651089.1 FAD dependent oxidoreductase [Penicillium longicatenatum]